jgi:hypothetical protein
MMLQQQYELLDRLLAERAINDPAMVAGMGEPQEGSML